MTLATGCDSGQPPVAPSPTPSAAAATPAPGYAVTPVPFNLTGNRTFEVWGWDGWPGPFTPSAVQFRWNGTVGKYEVIAPGAVDWSRLEARPADLRLWTTPVYFDAFASGDTKLPFSMFVWLPPPTGPVPAYVGDARILNNALGWPGGNAGAWFKFGIRTEPGDVPVSGTRTCNFGEDEIGGGEMTFDFAAGTLSGWVEPFWGGGLRHQLVQTSFAPGATTFAARFGTAGAMEGRFFGPRAVNVAIRSRGGGDGFAAVSGIMTGMCEG